MEPQAIWKMRRTMGWFTVLVSVGAIGAGAYLILRVFTLKLPLLVLLEPCIMVVFGVAILPTALSFMDPRRSGLH